ncbi:MAG: alpha/beta fold hydrolase [Actinobacteria bacterium]|nr:alpha/beta fold hydrolase [Actinomycetota bacterium]
MRDHPLFVPFRGDHLAAVVTTPEQTARGLVVFLQGAGGATRTHRYRLWTRAARRLAGDGIASVRMDYRGIGDSTGAYAFEMEAPPVEEALTVVTLVLDRLGLDGFGVVGNCIGARTAFGLAARTESCRSVACILPMALGPVLERRGENGVASLGASTAKLLPGRVAHWASRVRRLGPFGGRPDLRFIPEVSIAVRGGTKVLFLHGGTEESRQRLVAGAKALPAVALGEGASPVQIWRMPAEGTSGFRPLETQRVVVDSVTEWMDRTLPVSAADARSTRRSAGAA